ncbi:MAG TPA: hypothetical protein VEC37_18945 [Bacillota bacterium]|nr:hypothetical protein [Bacillota bacterium]
MANFNFPFNFAPGVTVTITTADGTAYTGELVKLEDGYVVLNAAGTITLINLTQITTVVPA